MGGGGEGRGKFEISSNLSQLSIETLCFVKSICNPGIVVLSAHNYV